MHKLKFMSYSINMTLSLIVIIKPTHSKAAGGVIWCNLNQLNLHESPEYQQLNYVLLLLCTTLSCWYSEYSIISQSWTLEEGIYQSQL